MSTGTSLNPRKLVEALWLDGRLGAFSDDALLSRFVHDEPDRAERAFAALVERHGPRVYRVCRAVTGNNHAAEDAFQATFLVLARKAARIRVGDSLGPWLHGVAARVASSARTSAARRLKHESNAASRSVTECLPATRDADLEAILHEEIGRLPSAYRDAVFLCDIEGLDLQSAALRMSCAVGTVKSRLSRGRSRVRNRLLSRGIAPLTLAALATRSARACPPDRLIQSTVKNASALVSGGTISSSIPAGVVILWEEGMTAMLRTKLRALVGISLIGLSAASAVVYAQDSADKPVRGHVIRTDTRSADGPAGTQAITVTGMNISSDSKPTSNVAGHQVKIQSDGPQVRVSGRNIARRGDLVTVNTQVQTADGPAKVVGRTINRSRNTNGDIVTRTITTDGGELATIQADNNGGDAKVVGHTISRSRNDNGDIETRTITANGGETVNITGRRGFTINADARPTARGGNSNRSITTTVVTGNEDPTDEEVFKQFVKEKIRDLKIDTEKVQEALKPGEQGPVQVTKYKATVSFRLGDGEPQVETFVFDRSAPHGVRTITSTDKLGRVVEERIEGHSADSRPVRVESRLASPRRDTDSRLASPRKDADSRLDEVERKLERVLKALEKSGDKKADNEEKSDDEIAVVEEAVTEVVADEKPAAEEGDESPDKETPAAEDKDEESDDEDAAKGDDEEKDDEDGMGDDEGKKDDAPKGDDEDEPCDDDDEDQAEKSDDAPSEDEPAPTPEPEDEPGRAG